MPATTIRARIPEVWAALAAANPGHATAYGDDEYSARAREAIREALDAPDAQIFFLYTGTAANVLGLRHVLKPWEAVVCGRGAHLNSDECAAPEQFIGCKLLLADEADGKISPETVAPLLGGRGDEHRAQPRVISVSQATEVGTLYANAELNALADFAHERGLLLHVDGARWANAAAALGCGLREMISATGVDIFSLGGTKNGLMCGEAVVFLRPGLAADFKFTHKQGMQLASKTRFIAAQFLAYFHKELWRRNAEAANAAAQRLAEGAARVPGVRLAHPCQANGVFARLPEAWIAPLQARRKFYVWDETASIVRWMCSFDTTAEEVDDFLALLEEQSS